MTAIFTDIKGFSTISEQLDPADLVNLLNLYLTDMSNIVLEQRGTIDKYEETRSSRSSARPSTWKNTRPSPAVPPYG